MSILEDIKIIKQSRLSEEEQFVNNFFNKSKRIKTFWKSDYILYRNNNSNILFIDTKNKKMYLNYGINFYKFQELKQHLVIKYISDYVGVELKLGIYEHYFYPNNIMNVIKYYIKEIINKIKTCK